jgi:hypothetical protein
MKLLNNLSITAKSLISTLIGVLVVTGMAVLAVSSFVAFQPPMSCKASPLA